MSKEFDYQRAHDLFYKMIKVTRSHRSSFEHMHSSLGIHHSQHRLLMYISKQQSQITQKDIASHFGISAAAVAVSLKKLEDGGYIERKSLESDTRFNTITATEKGKSVVSMSQRHFSEADRAMFEGFSEMDYENLSACLDKMAEGIKNYSENFDTKDDK